MRGVFFYSSSEISVSAMGSSTAKSGAVVLVSVGDKINKGDLIGTVGSTGRSTGPHLDFRVNWFQTRLDPMSIFN